MVSTMDRTARGSGLRRSLLLVGRVAVLAQDALHDHAQVRPHVLAHRPIARFEAIGLYR